MILENIGERPIESEQRINQQDLDVVPKPDKPQHEETHIKVGQLLKSFVYGGVDGSSNVLIVITSGISSGITAHQILALCIAVCIGDGIVMGLGDYLSAKAQMSFIKAEEQRQAYEIQHFLPDQKQQIIDFYQIQKYSLQDSTRIAELYSTNKKAFINIMMLQELQLVVVDDHVIAIKCGIVTFLSFIFFGILPVLPFIVTSGIMKQETRPWIPSLCIGGAQFISLGVLKATIIGGNKLKSAFEIFVISSVATAVGYAIGFAFPI